MKLHAPVKGIFFDIGWTLLYPVTKDWWINKKMREYIDMNTYALIPQNRKDFTFKRAQKYLSDNHLLFTEEEELRQYETAYSIIANELPELGLLNEQVNEIAYYRQYMNSVVLFDDTVLTLDTLKGKYKLGLISDTWPSVKRWLKYGGIYDYFDTRTFSCFLGACKPDERMYLHALEQMKLPPEQTVFIDDCVENLEGAEKCGIQPVLITAGPEAENSDKYPSIKKISELIEILPE